MWFKGEGRGGGWGTHYISMGKDVLTKGVLFSESVWSGCVFRCKISGKGLTPC